MSYIFWAGNEEASRDAYLTWKERKPFVTEESNLIESNWALNDTDEGRNAEGRKQIGNWLQPTKIQARAFNKIERVLLHWESESFSRIGERYAVSAKRSVSDK